MISISKKSSIKKGDRVFYELSCKRHPLLEHSEENIYRTGRFKEILDVDKFLREDSRLNDPSYIRHHNLKVLR